MSHSLLWLLSGTPTSDLRSALEVWGLGQYWEPILRSDAYRVAFLNNLRLALMMKSALNSDMLSPYGLVSTSKLSFLGAVGVEPFGDDTIYAYNGLPYIFLSPTERPDAHRLVLLELELVARPEILELLKEQLVSKLSEPAQQLLSQGFDPLKLSPEQIRPAFELLGSRPLVSQPYDLPSLVEHYCALMGSTPEQVAYLQAAGKKVYYHQQRPLPQYFKDYAYYYRPQVTADELRAAHRAWVSRLKMFPEIQQDSLSQIPHYFIQAWLDRDSERLQMMMEEFFLDPELAAIELEPGWNKAQDLLLEACYRLVYQPAFVRWLSEAYGDQPVVAGVLRSPQWPWRILIYCGYAASVELLLRHMDRERIPVKLMLEACYQGNQQPLLEMLLGWLPPEPAMAWLRTKGEAEGPVGLTLSNRLYQLEQLQILKGSLAKT